MITIEDLMNTIEMQEREIERLQRQINKLQAWSDYNDLTLRELVDNLTDTVDRLVSYHQEEKARQKISKEDMVNGMVAAAISNS